MLSRKPRLVSFRRFLRCQDGAVTADWIVLTAAIVTIGVAVTFYVGSAVPTLGDNLSAAMSEYEVMP
ncbi:MAG TPA: hypothetical protein ENJ52_13140 [Aliiroseovarius sp.]|nr:hypothetical protein [Aliiroseovarius sp.]